MSTQQSFNFKQFLEENDFTEFDKIEKRLSTNELTLDDIFDCNDEELKKLLLSFGVSSLIQRKRFIRAIKKLTQPKFISDEESGLQQTEAFLHNLQKIKSGKTSLWSLANH